MTSRSSSEPERYSSAESTEVGKGGEVVVVSRLDKKTNAVQDKYADEVLHFMDQHAPDAVPLTEEEEKKLRHKNFAYILAVAILVTLVLFMDKATIGYTTILGIYIDTDVDKGRFNNLNSVFYGGYLLAQWPGHYLLQKLPVGKYMAGTVFSWAILVGVQAACNSYASLMVIRFFLGAVEAVAVPAMEMTLGMFLTAREREIAQPVFWTAPALAPVISSFIAFGLLHVRVSVQPWRIFMAVNAGISLFLAVFVWFFYPDNPAKATHLTTNEKVHLIQKVQESTKSSIEQKTFKKHQAIECLKDPVSWLFFLQAFTLMLANSMTYQQNQLFVDIGVTTFGSSLVSAAGGGFTVVLLGVSALLIRRFPGQSGYFSASYLIPCIIAAIGMVTIPWENKIALLACMILLNFKGFTYIVALGWTTSSCSGYTKKLYRNILFMLAYGIANIISPQLWNPKDSPRYYPSWIVQIVIAFFLNLVILLAIRIILARRNAKRRAWIAENGTDGAFGYVINHDDDGREIKEKVDVAMLDLTDFENKYFIYPL
ncbi:BA75_01851T0 [Komagataella pastoris]|uniref:BA75_01851T0 n=1 Tax=Komagataella pastoris TaxID=4922 RepID=A0A1B2J6D4_PICPA|nr:BA75_01851T0 [Komagataella pastoris]